MTANDWLEQLGFLLVALLTLGSALGVILTRRVLHAALWLLPTLVGVACVYGILGAHLLFAMQIIVYVGAITVLIVFGVMLLEETSPAPLSRPRRDGTRRRLGRATDLVLRTYGGMQHVLAGVAAAGMMFVLIIAALIEAACFQQWGRLQSEGAVEFAGNNVELIGKLFLTKYLLPFELASLVLLVALVGAVVLARPHQANDDDDKPASGAEADESAAKLEEGAG